MDEGIYIFRGEAEMIDVPQTFSLYYPIEHLPQSLGVTIARLIGLSFFGAFYLGRLFNLVFYVLCVAFAIKLVGAFKLPLFIIGILPMSLQQAASLSSDAFLNGMSLLFIAYTISCIYERDIVRWRDYIALIVIGVLVAPAKAVYFPLVFLVLLISKRWKEVYGRKAWLITASIALVAVASALIFYGTRTADIAGVSGPVANWEGGYNYTISFALAYPIETIVIFLRTFYHWHRILILEVFGMHLSGMSIFVPLRYIYMLMLICVASAFFGKRDEWHATIKERIVYFVISGIVVVLVFASMFFGWTSDWHDVILGLQGRYFIPLLPLALLIIRTKKLLIPFNAFRNSLIIATVLVQCMIVLEVLAQTGA